VTLLVRWCAAAVFAAAAVAPAGCGGGGLASVDGTVTVSGKPLKQGSITFAPDKGPPAIGTIVDGKITGVKTSGSPGVPVGPCTVLVTSLEPGLDPADPPYSVVQGKYGSPGSSDLKTEIKSGSNEVKFDLMPGDSPRPRPKPKDKPKDKTKK